MAAPRSTNTRARPARKAAERAGRGEAAKRRGAGKARAPGAGAAERAGQEAAAKRRGAGKARAAAAPAAAAAAPDSNPRRGGGTGISEPEAAAYAAAAAAAGEAMAYASPESILKRVDAVTESARMLTEEMGGISKIFAENQEVLVSMKAMIDGLAGAVETMHESAREAGTLKEDTRKLFAGLEGVRARSDAIAGLADQASRLDDRMEAIERRGREATGIEAVSRKVSESMESIRSMSAMLAKIAGSVDEGVDGLKEVAARTETVLAAGREIEEIKKGLWILGERTKRMEAGAGDASAAVETAVRDGLKMVADRAAAAVKAETGAVAAEVSAAREEVARAAAAAAGAGEAGPVGKEAGENRARPAGESPRPGRQQQLEDVAGRIESIEAAVAALAKASVGPGGVQEAVEAGIAGIGGDLAGKAAGLEQRAGALADAAARSEESAAGLCARVDEALGLLRGLAEARERQAGGATAEAMALLRLSEYESAVRMRAESKYGNAQDIESMAARTAEIAGILGGIPAGPGGGRPLPGEVGQWAVSKMLECADRWDVRFSDALEALVSGMGVDALKGAVRVQQVKDVYGARAAAEMRSRLGIAEKGQRA